MAEQMQEHIYIIPLRDARRMPRWKRANGAIKDIRKYLAKHMKTEDVKLDKTINEKVWSRGSGKPPSKIRVRAMKTGRRAGPGRTCPGIVSIWNARLTLPGTPISGFLPGSQAISR